MIEAQLNFQHRIDATRKKLQKRSISHEWQIVKEHLASGCLLYRLIRKHPQPTNRESSAYRRQLVSRMLERNAATLSFDE